MMKLRSQLRNQTTLEYAWYHKDDMERKKWQDAINLEFNQMMKSEVWNRKGQPELPNGRKGIGTRWIFKIKKDGVYRARLVAKGYNQQAGVEFDYNYAPVLNEVTFRVMLILLIANNYYAEVADIQTAFLHRHLKEEFYLKEPEGYQEFLGERKSVNCYIKLNKSIYGLVQAARAWWK